MALLTICQATFENFQGYEDELDAVKESVRTCQTEISKSASEISMLVSETYAEKSELEGSLKNN